MLGGGRCFRSVLGLAVCRRHPLWGESATLSRGPRLRPGMTFTVDGMILGSPDPADSYCAGATCDLVDAASAWAPVSSKESENLQQFQLDDGADSALVSFIRREYGLPGTPRGRQFWPGVNAVNYFLGQRYVEAFEKLATSDQQRTVIIPAEFSSLMGTIEGIRTLATSAQKIADPEAKPNPWGDKS